MKKKENGICHIVGAGDFAPHLLKKQKGDLLIAADAGFLSLKDSSANIDLAIGDWDSLGSAPESVPSKVLPKVKDDTDTLAAVKHGLFMGYRRFHLYGALGGKRFSHSLANLQTLSFLQERGAQGKIIDENCTVSLLTEGEYSFSLSETTFSLFSFQGEAVVSVSGAKYPLSAHPLTPSFPLGVSNEGEGASTRIQIHSGRVFLVIEK
jgi:thiamine pyrophosphokinase